MTETETMYCVNHPDRETLLRCNKCNQPICIQCAVRTPTGYRCKSCIRSQQSKFNTAQTSDYIFAPLIAFILSFIGSYLVSFLGFFTLFVAPSFGIAIVRVVRSVIKNHRSNALFFAASAAGAVGSFPLLSASLFPMISTLGAGGFNIYSLLPLLWQAAYSILITGTIYYRLKGISF
ncbi:MAG: B-box zinc finger protein [Anaerolineaceae bacterium]|nr:B-box zinc finger protein [Anaerolineaceae bacterium]